MNGNGTRHSVVTAPAPLCTMILSKRKVESFFHEYNSVAIAYPNLARIDEPLQVDVPALSSVPDDQAGAREEKRV